MRCTRCIADFHRLGLADRMHNGFLVEQVVAVRLFLMANHMVVVIKIEGREICYIKEEWFVPVGLRGVDHVRDH